MSPSSKPRPISFRSSAYYNPAFDPITSYGRTRSLGMDDLDIKRQDALTAQAHHAHRILSPTSSVTELPHAVATGSKNKPTST